MNKRWIYLLLPGIVLLSGCLTTLCYAADPAPATTTADSAPATTAADSAAVATAKETEVKKWSLEECIYTALHNHGDVLTSEQTVLSSKAAYTQAKGDYFHDRAVVHAAHLRRGGARREYYEHRHVDDRDTEHL